MDGMTSVERQELLDTMARFETRFEKFERDAADFRREVREDMGAMLDLKLETVSREVSALVREKVIEPLDKQGRVYRILDLPALQSI